MMRMHLLWRHKQCASCFVESVLSKPLELTTYLLQTSRRLAQPFLGLPYIPILVGLTPPLVR